MIFIFLTIFTVESLWATKKIIMEQTKKNLIAFGTSDADSRRKYVSDSKATTQRTQLQFLFI